MSQPAVLVACLALALVPAAASAESAVDLPAPSVLGGIDASTYDLEGNRVGDAELAVTRLDNGHLELRSLSGIEGSAQLEVVAELAPRDDASALLRPIYQQTEARDEQGQSLGVTRIDHRRRVAECGVPEGSGLEPARIELPKRDRVVNVPLNLLFQPLVRGEVDEVDFQVLLCRAGARIVDAQARVAQDLRRDGNHLVEIRYAVDLGPVLSRLAAPFMPELSFWFDDRSPGGWVGHRMPLFSKGPTVMVIRRGFAPTVLGSGR